MSENITQNESVEISIFPSRSFSMRLPDTPEGTEIFVTVIYHETDDTTITAEAWLSRNYRTAMKFLGDVFTFDPAGMSEDEIEDKILALISESETFSLSVDWLIKEKYNYFIVEFSPAEIKRYKTCSKLFEERFFGMAEYLDNLDEKTFELWYGKRHGQKEDINEQS